MIHYKIWIKVVPQIMKDLVNNLFNCKARFELITYRNEFTIYNIEQFYLDEQGQYIIIINTENNIKSIGIAKDNIEMLTLHI